MTICRFGIALKTQDTVLKVPIGLLLSLKHGCSETSSMLVLLYGSCFGCLELEVFLWSAILSNKRYSSMQKQYLMLCGNVKCRGGMALFFSLLYVMAVVQGKEALYADFVPDQRLFHFA